MSDNGGGVSMGQVDRAIASAVNPLVQILTRQQQQLTQLENEMANVEGAVREMSNGLRSDLRDLKSGNASMLEVQQQTKKLTLEQFVATNVQLGQTNLQLSTTNSNLGTINHTSEQGFRTLDVGIDRMAQALVQTEVIRLLHEAKEPTERVHAFAEEIEQRFVKTVENVYLVRSQYDHLLGTSMGEYENKLRVIGEHIYQMYEDDFRQWAETPLCVPPGRAVELPLSLDEQRLDSRREALESRFAKLGDELIEPLLQAHRSLEHSLASQFASGLEVNGEELALPVAVRVTAGGELEVLGRVRTEFDPRLAPSERRVTLKALDDGEANAAKVIRVERVAKQLKTVRLAEEQLAQLKQALERLGGEGRIDPDLVPGYVEYLDTFGLEMIAEQEVKTP